MGEQVELRAAPPGLQSAAGTLASEAWERAAEDLRRRIKGDLRPVALPGDWGELPELLGGSKCPGWWPGLHVLVGLTGSGKTQFALQAALAAAQGGSPVCYVALELTEVEILARLAALLDPAVQWGDLLRGDLSTRQWEGDRGDRGDRGVRQVVAAGLRGLPLRVLTASAYRWNPVQLRAIAGALKHERTERPPLVVVDYLQVVGDAQGEQGEQAGWLPSLDPRERIGLATYAAREAVREHDCAVLLLSSVPRASYDALRKRQQQARGKGQQDKPPPPETFVGLGKESGEIEYSADAVLVLDVGERSASRCRVEVVVAKNRHGRTGRVPLWWNFTRFRV